MALAGCGTITFGDPLSIDASSDGGRRDAAPSDAGPRDASPADAAPACVSDDPPAPASWPFATRLEAYQQEFYDPAMGTGCGRAACHGGPAANSPFIPTAISVLSNATELDRAINQLWPTVADDPPTLLGAAVHKGDGDFPYTPAVRAALEAFVEKAISCRWKPIYARRDGGIECTGGPADAGGSRDAGVADAGGARDAAPADAADGGRPDAVVSADAGDAGARDSGRADGGAAPADAGGGAGRVCSCPLPSRDLSFCGE